MTGGPLLEVRDLKVHFQVKTHGALFGRLLLGRARRSIFRHDFEAALSGQVVLVPLQDQIDALANVDGNRNLGARVQQVKELVLLRRDVDGGRDLLSGHRALADSRAVTLDSHTCIVNPLKHSNSLIFA